MVVDPAVYSTSGILNKTRLDLMAGFYLYSPDYFIGVSAQQIVPQKIDFSNGYIRPSQGSTVPHLFGTAGLPFFGERIGKYDPICNGQIRESLADAGRSQPETAIS